MTHASGVYKIVNSATGRIYVGSSVDLAERWHSHRGALQRGNHKNRHLQAAWNKRGAAAFTFTPLLICAAGDVLFYEQLCIDGYMAVSRGYNKSPIAGNTSGRVLSADARANISAAKRGRPQSAETREKRAAIMRSAEVRAKVSASKKGKARTRPITDAHRVALSAALRGHVVSPETRAKLAAANTGKKKGPHTPETRQKMAAAQKGRVFSPEHRARMSEAQRRRYAREVAV